MLEFEVEIVHSYTDYDKEESSYSLTIHNDEPIICETMSQVGEILKQRVISELLDWGYY
jgi:hypothetical protein